MYCTEYNCRNHEAETPFAFYFLLLSSSLPILVSSLVNFNPAGSSLTSLIIRYPFYCTHLGSETCRIFDIRSVRIFLGHMALLGPFPMLSGVLEIHTLRKDRLHIPAALEAELELKWR